ncbi:hypothetical protein D3C71_2171010 [compost metagenome]
MPTISQVEVAVLKNCHSRITAAETTDIFTPVPAQPVLPASTINVGKNVLISIGAD